MCPSCGKKRAILWAEGTAEVLPQVPYAGLVFTIPKMLRCHFLWDRTLYSDLCREAYAATLEFLQAHFPALKNAVPAMVISPQSFGSLLNFHPHLHALLSLGLFDREEGSFHPAGELDFKPLEEIFRSKTLRLMVRRGKITEERAGMLRSWVHSGFQVSADRRIEAGDRNGLESLLEYMERAPVSLERLEYRLDGMVLYRGNFHPGLGTDHRLVTGIEFLALLVPHIILRFECAIRYYGAISTTIRRQFGWIKPAEHNSQMPTKIPVLEGEESEFVKVRKRNWRYLIAKVWLEDPALCPRCKKPMRVIAAISSPAQDQVDDTSYLSIELPLEFLTARCRDRAPWLRIG